MRPLVIALGLALGACALVERPDAPPAAVSAAEDLGAYLARLRGMNEAALAAEARRQRQAAARDGLADAGRVKAGLALTFAQADDFDVAALVEPVVRREKGDAVLRGMASFLQVIAQDRRRLKESAAAAQARLREERRAHEAQKGRAEAAHERAAQLQQKLDALSELEKSLSDRSVPSR